MADYRQWCGYCGEMLGFGSTHAPHCGSIRKAVEEERERSKQPELTVVEWEAHDDWNALYVNGKLDRVGDRYLTDERIQTLVGVQYLEADYLMGGDHRKDAAPTLDALNEYHEKTVDRQQAAERLREQANALLEEAEAVEKGLLKT